MKIELSESSASYSVKIDGKEEITLTDKQRVEVINCICNWLKKHPKNLNYALQSLVADFYDDYKCNNTLPNGNCHYTYTLNIS